MMPTMEDSLDGNSNHSNIDLINNNSSSSTTQNVSGMSKAELRKSNKPIMEKRRRARINNCLNELKSLILDAMKKPARHTKLEKADILEMTVKHLQTIQRQQLSVAMQTDPTVIHKFKSGFSECTDEINRYLSQLDGVDSGVRQRLMNHLNNCATGLEHVGSFSNFGSAYRTNASPFPSALHPTTANIFPLSEDVNNNARLNVRGAQLIPSRLPTGEVALIVPNSNSIPLFSSALQLPTLDIANHMQRFSAFAKPSSGGFQSSSMRPSTSPPLSPISSVSSCGDESFMHTSSDFPSKSSQWELNQSISSQTSMSPESSKYMTGSGTIQQAHISSTSETPNTSRKRLYVEVNEGYADDLNGNPPAKLQKSNTSGDAENSTQKQEPQNAATNSDMWRPW